MSAELLAGADFTWAAVYALLASFFAVLSLRRGAEGLGYAVFAAGCIAVGGYSICSGMHYRTRDLLIANDWSRRAFVLAPIGGALVLHAITMYGHIGARVRRWVLLVAYVPGVSFAALGAARLMPHARVPIFAPDGSLIGEHFTSHPAFAAYAVWHVSAATWVLGVAIRRYARGAREASLTVIGAVLLGICMVHDLLVLRGTIRSVIWSEHGFSALAFGFSYTLLARHERIADELAKKGAELRQRARLIRKAYEELRAAQEELVRKEQLAVIGELAAVVSHEVRNPLAVITNAVAALRRPATSTEDRAMLLTIVDEETDRLNRLVGDLLRYSRPFVAERRPLNLEALVGRALELVNTPPFVDKVKLDRLAIDGGLPKIHGDPDLMRQVLDNLIQNACQAMPTGGTLTVGISAAQEEGRGGVRIAIADTGEGMDTLVRSRARTPFFTTRPGGTGLGLAICDRIVKAHGGVLSIQSRSGEGTEVRVWLPEGVVEVSPIRSSRPPSSTGSPDSSVERAPE